MSSGRRSNRSSRDSPAESRQPEDEGRPSSSRRGGNSSNYDHSSVHSPPPRTPRSSGGGGSPTTPSSQFSKARCYRLNLEKPFDISNEKSPASLRDYGGAPPPEPMETSPTAGPLEYYPPPHLLPREELRRHSWGATTNTTTASELMANLQVSCSEESSANDRNETSVAISTARIFRGITVDRNGVITSQNARATRSRKGGDGKNKQGEKSRQAAKIDKAKDLIDDIADGAAGSGPDDENDPSKMVSLYVMGEYEELNDLVRDGSKKLRDAKTLPDEAILSLNRPRPTPNHINSPTAPPDAMNSPTSHHANSNNPTNNSGHNGSVIDGSTRHDPTSPASASTRKRGGSGAGYHGETSSKARSRYKQVPRSAPPKLKSHPRDHHRSSSRRSNTTSSSTTNTNSTSNNGSTNTNNNSSTVPTNNNSSNNNQNKFGMSSPSDSWGGGSTTAGSDKSHHYFREQCNFFPAGNSDWTEALGFSVNSLWNCGAYNNGQMSPASNPSSPRSHHSNGNNNGTSNNGAGGGGQSATSSTHHGHGKGGGSGAYGYHYGHHNHHHSRNSNNNNGGFEDRNPGYGYADEGYGRSRNYGVRDTVVM